MSVALVDCPNPGDCPELAAAVSVAQVTFVSPSAQGGRGLTRGLIFKTDGTLVASVAQEGSVRERR